MITTRSAAALLIAAALALAGCSSVSAGSPAAGTSESAVAEATGESIQGAGYAFTAPEGWGVPDADTIGEVGGAGGLGEGVDVDVDSIIADLTDTDGFADNVNVVVTLGQLTPDEVETQGARELETIGTDVAVRDRVTVADRECAHLSALISLNGLGYNIDQFFLTRDAQTYVVTFSFSPTVSGADRDDLAKSVLATWAWT